MPHGARLGVRERTDHPRVLGVGIEVWIVRTLVARRLPIRREVVEKIVEGGLGDEDFTGTGDAGEHLGDLHALPLGGVVHQAVSTECPCNRIPAGNAAGRGWHFLSLEKKRLPQAGDALHLIEGRRENSHRMVGMVAGRSGEAAHGGIRTRRDRASPLQQGLGGLLEKRVRENPLVHRRQCAGQSALEMQSRAADSEKAQIGCPHRAQLLLAEFIERRSADRCEDGLETRRIGNLIENHIQNAALAGGFDFKNPAGGIGHQRVGLDKVPHPGEPPSELSSGPLRQICHGLPDHRVLCHPEVAEQRLARVEDRILPRDAQDHGSESMHREFSRRLNRAPAFSTRPKRHSVRRRMSSGSLS